VCREKITFLWWGLTISTILSKFVLLYFKTTKQLSNLSSFRFRSLFPSVSEEQGCWWDSDLLFQHTVISIFISHANFYFSLYLSSAYSSFWHFGSRSEMEYDEYVVEAVIADRKVDGELQFLVKWVGWDHSYDTWVSSICLY